eukprot:6480563-Amphidinium_carterae.1
MCERTTLVRAAGKYSCSNSKEDKRDKQFALLINSLPNFAVRSRRVSGSSLEYFDQLYEWAEHLISNGKAFVDSEPQ